MVEGPCWPCPLQSGTFTFTLSCLSWSPKCWEEEGSAAGMGRAVPCPPASAPSTPRGTRSSFRTCFGFAFHLGVLNHRPVKAKLCVIPCVTGCTCRLEPTFRFLGSGSPLSSATPGLQSPACTQPHPGPAVHSRASQGRRMLRWPPAAPHICNPFPFFSCSFPPPRAL